MEIIPAILAKDYEEMKDKIALVRGICPIVQIDFCDGIFVKNKTWPFTTGGVDDVKFKSILNEQEGMPFWQDIDFELDLMVADAVENFDIYTKLGPKRIIFHIEAVGNLEEFKNFLEGIDVYVRDIMQIGVAINMTTPIEQIFSLVNNVDFVQCMGIEKTGFQGQPFDERALVLIQKLKKDFPDVTIQVDGGVSDLSAPDLIASGAERLVSGSFILESENPKEALRTLSQTQ